MMKRYLHIIILLTIGWYSNVLSQTALTNPGSFACCQEQALQVSVVSSKEVFLGEFIIGMLSFADYTFNEITFIVTANDKKKHNVRLFNTNSDIGSDQDVKIYTEWIVGNNKPFLNGSNYSFKESLEVKVRTVKVFVSINVKNIYSRYFDQVLTVEKLD